MKQSLRLWLLAASVVTRGSGYLTSFALARFAGELALGSYSVLVNTASTVASPFLGVLSSSATVHAVREGASKITRAPGIVKAQLAFGGAIASVAALVFTAFYVSTQTDDRLLAPNWTLYLAGTIWVYCQMLGAIVQGTLFGLDRFSAVARSQLLVGALLLVAAFPLVHLFGLSGAVGLLVFSSLALVAPFARSIAKHEGWPNAETWRRVIKQFSANLPALGATTASSAVSWYCTIYLVHQVHGTQAVGVMAVSTQWLTMMLIPVTSWGGLTLKRLVNASKSGERQEIQITVWRLVVKNVLSTLPLAALVAIMAMFIASIYGLSHTKLAELLWISVAIALVTSTNNVFERLMICLSRQRLWLIISAGAYAAQLAVTYTWLSESLLAVAFGILAAVVIVGASSTIWLLVHLRIRS